MPTGLDVIERDRRLQNHWMLRIAAFLIDYVLISSAFWVAFVFVDLKYGFWVFPFAGGFLLAFYSAVMESSYGETLGKRVMKLKTTSIMGPLEIQKTMVRNISKIHPAFVLVDVLLGFTSEGDPRQKYTDRSAGTTVVETAHLYNMPPPPAPVGGSKTSSHVDGTEFRQQAYDPSQSASTPSSEPQPHYSEDGKQEF